jgi:hypothetical protein
LTQKKFEVIKGGSDAVLSPRGNRFISAYVTDTRLMGVLALYIHWIIDGLDGPTDFHQFFYFDAEEYGLETYKSFVGDDELALTVIEQGLIGGLGGVKVAVSERESTYLVQSFVSAGKQLHMPLPDPKSEYDFLLQNPIILSPQEMQALIDKICTPILSDYHLIHYFLMRCVSRDQEGASYLTYGKLNIDDIAEAKPATLCRNSIEEYMDDNKRLSYLCEALVEVDGKYTLLVLEITTARGKVTSAYRRSSFRVTASEAAMLLNRPEYVTVYEILTDPDDFDEKFLAMAGSSMQTSHENGRLFLEFNKTNDHVNRKVFRLNEDIHGLYFVSDFGQLILAAYGLDQIHALEKTIQKSPLHPSLLPTAKYEFKEPILYEFIQSDFDDFADFLESLK